MAELSWEDFRFCVYSREIVMIYKERGQARHLSSSDNIETTLCWKPGKGNHMSGEASYDPAPFYVLNLKYVFEGILMPTIGLIGIIGIELQVK